MSCLHLRMQLLKPERKAREASSKDGMGSVAKLEHTEL